MSGRHRPKAEYDKSVEEGYRKKAEWESQNGPGTYTLTIEPFQDPGEAQRNKAVTDYFDLCDQMKAHGSTAAAAVRSSCDGADAARNWLESGLAFAGDMLLGAFESLKETSDFITNIQYGFLIRGISDLSKLATGELTQEEWIAKTALPAQEAKAVMNAAYSDPKAFGGAVVESPLQRGQIQGRASQGHWWAPPRCSIGSSQRRKQRSRKRCLEDRQQRIQNGPVRLQDSEGSQGRQGQG